MTLAGLEVGLDEVLVGGWEIALAVDLTISLTVVPAERLGRVAISAAALEAAMMVLGDC